MTITLYNESIVKPTLTIETLGQLADYLDYNNGMVAEKNLVIDDFLSSVSKGSIRWNITTSSPTIEGNCLLYVIDDTSSKEAYIIVEHFDDVTNIKYIANGTLVYRKIADKLGRK